ncbi:lipid IV(A) 3-deoxy-D-manno-octulosonic acid transferase [Celerinatantimonas yamalensis]|uniref:3-deoxy-D-manno-octulosonic acid transferase n=1 Tax=Celerinatantimonas yamalensis TaxID=559956 RepID=A0ABW9GBD9_9GAMM
MKQLLVRLAYNLLLLPGLIFACYRLYWPKAGKQPFGRRWREHFGISRAVKSPEIWLHAVSVGEVIGCVALVKALKARHPDWQILLTTTTATGAQEVHKRLGDQVVHRYAPFDCWPCIWLFLQRHHPQQLWIMETELWLNWLSLCRKRQIPVKLINARLSARSTQRYQQFATFAQLLFTRLSWIGAQYPTDAQNFIAVGAAPEIVEVTGSIKYDLHLDPARIQAARSQRYQLFGQRPVVIAASTHAGEDQIMLDIAAKLRVSQPALLLILVPRHPERFTEVGELLGAQVRWVSRSDKTSIPANTQVYLGDTMGELMDLFAMSDVAIMGGSFAGIGGHNYLEPAALGVPCVSGPSDFNFGQISAQLQQTGALYLSEQHEQLVSQMAKWLSDPQAYQQASAGALSAVQANQGATARSLNALLT